MIDRVDKIFPSTCPSQFLETDEGKKGGEANLARGLLTSADPDADRDNGLVQILVHVRVGVGDRPHRTA